MKTREFINKLKNMTVDELYEELSKTKKELFDYRVKAVTDVIENQAKFKQIKKNIARIETFLKQKSIEEKQSKIPDGT